MSVRWRLRLLQAAQTVMRCAGGHVVRVDQHGCGDNQQYVTGGLTYVLCLKHTPSFEHTNRNNSILWRTMPWMT